MNIEHIQTVFEIDEVNFSGFYEISLFKFYSETISLDDILRTDILSEQKRPKYFGPFEIKLLSKKDFLKINSNELKTLLQKLYEDERWGADLKVFKENVIKVFNKINVEKDEIHYISLEKRNSEIKNEVDFWAYFFGFVCIDKSQKLVKKNIFWW